MHPVTAVQGLERNALNKHGMRSWQRHPHQPCFPSLNEFLLLDPEDMELRHKHHIPNEASHWIAHQASPCMFVFLGRSVHGLKKHVKLKHGTSIVEGVMA